MIKEVLQQLEPLDAQIDALCSSTDDAEMANTTTFRAVKHAFAALHITDAGGQSFSGTPP